MNPIVFRTATRTDLAAIVALLADDPLGREREAAGASPAVVDARYVAAFEAIAADANQQLVVVTEGDTVVGTLQLSFIPGIARQGAWRGQIEAVRIAAQRRDAGLGQRMFEWAIARCRERAAPWCSSRPTSAGPMPIASTRSWAAWRATRATSSRCRTQVGVLPVSGSRTPKGLPGSGMNSVSPGTWPMRCAAQSSPACRMRSRRLETKFQVM